MTTARSPWRGLRNWTLAAALLALMPLTGMMRAQVTNVIYQDSFARVGPLVGTAPDTVNAPGAVWQGGLPPNGIVTDGTEAAITTALTNNPWANAWLPMLVETGHVYTLTCSILGNTNDNQQWLAMGFATAPGQISAINNGSVGAAWLLSRCGNSGCQFFHGNTSFGSLTYAPQSNFQIYSIVLNTATNPA